MSNFPHAGVHQQIFFHFEYGFGQLGRADIAGEVQHPSERPSDRWIDNAIAGRLCHRNSCSASHTNSCGNGGRSAVGEGFKPKVRKIVLTIIHFKPVCSPAGQEHWKISASLGPTFRSKNILSIDISGISTSPSWCYRAE